MGNVCSISIPCDAVFTRCLDCTSKKAAYVSKLEDNVNALRNELSKLTKLRDDVKNEVELAEQRQLKRLNQVQGWLSTVQAVETEVDKLITDGSQEIDKLCLGGYCSKNCKSSYELGKEVAEKLKIVVDLKREGAFEVVAEKVPEAAVDEMLTELKDNVKALEDELSKLIELRNDVMRRVVLDEQRQMPRLDQVRGWLSRVQTVQTEVGELITNSSQEIENLCPGGSSYALGKKVAKKLQIVANLKDEGRFEAVAERIPEPVGHKRPIEPTIVGLQSTFDNVWKCLREEQVGIIGLYGTGGVGKTTLLTHINNKFLDMSNDFDVVIWVVVSKDVQLERIQEKIAKEVKLFDDSWKNKSPEEKAQAIFEKLSKKKFVLLLDDIWEEVDLKEIGVPPFQSSKDSSKMVFTTRKYEVCGKMRAHMSFEVKCLGDDDSWKLFQENVGKNILQGHPDIPKLAKIIMKECAGLPLALITFGRAMACRKSPEEWKHAIKVLRESTAEFSGIEKKVFARLKFSYDNLHSDTIKTCFLYCSLFSEDYKIGKEELIDCWIGEGILNKYGGSGDRNHGHSIIGDLLSACLLEGGNYSKEKRGEDFVKMHDVIRDMALWIACDLDNEGRKFLVRTGFGLTEASKIVGLHKDVTRLSLMENKIENLSEPLECHHLITLFLNENNLRNISNGFFQFMSSLKVLKLSDNEYLTTLPPGISELVALQHLDLSWTSIRELPIELKALRNLKCLELEYTNELRKIPCELISNFSMLHVLRMFRCRALSFGDVVLVEELLKLEYLNVLTFDLTHYHAFQRFMSLHNLHTRTQSLRIDIFDNPELPSSNQLSLIDFNHLQYLEIDNCDFLEEIEIGNVSEIQQMREPSTVHSLHTLYICRCKNLRDLTWLVLLPNLRSIFIVYCEAMEEIIDARKLGDVPNTLENSFPKLERLGLYHLQDLKSIYPKPLPFPHLKEIFVSGCPKLKKLPLDSNSLKECKIVIKGHEDWGKELQWEDLATQNAFLSSFKPFNW